MPAAYLHEVIADMALDRLVSEGLDMSTIAAHHDAFLIGSQGPDPLFFYRILNPFNRRKINYLGETLHQKCTGDMLMALISYAKDDPVSMAYAVGWLCHYATDCTLHPYVYFRTNTKGGEADNIAHGYLEAALDTWIYQKHHKRGIPRQAKALSTITKAEKDRIATTLLKSIKQVFPRIQLNKRHVIASLYHMNKIIRLLYSPKGKKYRLYRWIEGLLKSPGGATSHAPSLHLPEDDFLNASKIDWHNPWEPDTLRNESIPELIDMAADTAAHYIAAAHSFWLQKMTPDKLSDVIGCNHYCSGLPLDER